MGNTLTLGCMQDVALHAVSSCSPVLTLTTFGQPTGDEPAPSAASANVQPAAVKAAARGLDAEVEDDSATSRPAGVSSAAAAAGVAAAGMAAVAGVAIAAKSADTTSSSDSTATAAAPAQAAKAVVQAAEPEEPVPVIPRYVNVCWGGAGQC